MIFFDTEGCGFHGPTVLIQWAEDDGPINLHSVWTVPISETMELIEDFCDHEDGICAFNLAFDWFHLCQLYTTLALFPDPSVLPEDHVEQYATYEKEARDGLCLKPVKALDIMLHARKGPYQSTMDRNDIRIKRVPTALAWDIAKELEVRIPLKDVYFARYKDKKERWQVIDIHDDMGDVIPEFKDVVLRFAPSSALKALAQDALGIEKPLFFDDVDLPKKARPNELGYAPYALAIGKPGDWNGAWPEIISLHISHWAYNELAREYASDDVLYVRQLWEFFGKPEADDDDSILACMVGAVRWKGFKIDVDAINVMKNKALELVKKVKKKFNFESPDVCKKYLYQVMEETEKLAIRVDGKITTKAVILDEIAKWKQGDVCDNCEGRGCKKCEDGMIESDEMHPAALRAKEILDARHAKKEMENFDKLLLADRFHASFNVIGTKSTRMSGADGLNPQGIKRTKMVRQCFPLAFKPLILCGGDFKGFEVTLADAAYQDPELRKDLQTMRPCSFCKNEKILMAKCHKCHGTGEEETKIHALFGTYLFPPNNYEQILATKETSTTLEEDLYTRSKNSVFAMLYGGEEYTLMTRSNVSEEAANTAYQMWVRKYKIWGEARKKIFNMFCSMRQPDGIGTKVEWHEPADYIESMFGFKRYFTLENTICKTLFELANKLPKSWKQVKLRVVRRDREQTATGAVSSALYAASFNMQAQNMRAAANHVIQSSGATVTKVLQKRIWDIQPSGINRWRVQPLNIHDEIMCPTVPQYMKQLETVVHKCVEDFVDRVPLLGIDWENNISSWADK